MMKELSRSQRSNEEGLTVVLFPKLTPKPGLLPSTNQNKDLLYTSKLGLNLEWVIFCYNFHIIFFKVPFKQYLGIVEITFFSAQNLKCGILCILFPMLVKSIFPLDRSHVHIINNLEPISINN